MSKKTAIPNKVRFGIAVIVYMLLYAVSQEKSLRKGVIAAPML